MYICANSILLNAVRTVFNELLCCHCCDDDRQATVDCYDDEERRGKLLPWSVWIALLVPSFPLPSLVPCHFWRAMALDLWGALSIDTFYSAQLLINGMDPQLVCPFCLKTDGAPPSSTRAGIFCSAPMHAWCGFCSCGKQEPGGGCCFRRICRSCIVGRQQETSGSVQ